MKIIKVFVDNTNGLSVLAWDTAYGDISFFLASDSAGTSFTVGGAVNLSQNPFTGRR